ncbi:flagellin [Paenibacillus thiaminolyticus]|uniref:flagellin n=1 Tax=Paenibacillus thiaminolyticus TaxID=49283 RepID=UPI0035A5854B
MSADSLKLTDKTKILEAHGLKFDEGTKTFTNLNGEEVTVTAKGGTAALDSIDAVIGNEVTVKSAPKAAFGKDTKVEAPATGTDNFAYVNSKLGLTEKGTGAGAYYEDKDGNKVGVLQGNGSVVYTKTAVETALGGSAAANTNLAAGNIVFEPAKDVNVKSELSITDVNLDTEEGARAAIATIENAINLVSSQRSEFGAVQNRLEHTINNLGVNAENLSASESRIRNADMAKEMTEFTRNQILVQAGTAMLAQANSAPQSVLKLLG